MAKKPTGTDSEQAMPPTGTAVAQPYVVLARKYRPETFDDLIGQAAMVQTLTNAFATDRIAQGYMLTGVRGVGKTTTARILARALNYAKPGIDKPTIGMDGFGEHCQAIIQSRHTDVLEMDAASNTGVDNIREIIESARYKPLVARYKVYIIDEVHMLSKGAFNALLKTLEEPPEHVKFIFATTEIRKVPVTVLSRCQRFDLRRVDVPELSAHLDKITTAEGATSEPDALAAIARAAEGSVRDALSLLDQAIAMGSGQVTSESVRAMLGLADRGRIFDLVELMLGGKPGDAVLALDALHKDGAEPAQVLADLAECIHIATRIKVAGAEAAGEGLSAEEQRRAAALSDQLSVPLMARAWQMLLKGLEEVPRAPDPLAAAEMVVIRIAHTADLPAPDAIIRALGGAGSARAAVGSGASQPPAQPPRGPLNGAPADANSRNSPVGEADPARPRSLPRTLPREAPPPAPPAAETAPATANQPMPANIDEVAALAGLMRDAMLRVNIEEYVSLVRFEPGRIEARLLDGAPPTLAGELAEKLGKWTGQRWIVAISREQGAPAIGQVRRKNEAAELARLKQHPTVQAVLETFPEAEVKSIRPRKGGTR